MFSWLAKFVRHPRRVGAVAPSSASLGRLMTRDIRPTERVLELGPGTGAITPFILERLDGPGRLTMIEIDPDFAAECRARFPGANVIRGDIADILARDAESYDVIVSGIPFAAMEKSRAEDIFRLIRDRLADGGRFVMFQYSKRTLKEIERVFGDVEIRFTPWNVPPAFVYVARKTRT